MFSLHPFSALSGSLKDHLLSPYWNHSQGYLPIVDALSKLGCQSIILEQEYIDADFVKDFGSFFSRFFRPHERTCQRLHFFLTDVNELDVDKLHVIVTEDKIRDEYLGYLVIRPTATYQIGRTAIPVPAQNLNHLTCSTLLKANLLGTSLAVRAMPYIQQDAQTGACAQAAIWMASHYMKERFGYRMAALSDITFHSTASSLALGEPTPASVGLTAEQMVWGLKSLGYSPLLIRKATDPEVDIQRIYSYLESEVPVILAVVKGDTGHALTVIGHDRQSTPRGAKTTTRRNSSEYVSKFLYHDDAVGPYLDLSLDPKAQQKWSMNDLTFIIVPLPRTVFVRSDEAKFIGHGENDDAVCGEIILDSTEDRFVPGYLALHFPGFLAIREIGHADPTFKKSAVTVHQLNNDADRPTLRWR